MFVTPQTPTFASVPGLRFERLCALLIAHTPAKGSYARLLAPGVVDARRTLIESLANPRDREVGSLVDGQVMTGCTAQGVRSRSLAALDLIADAAGTDPATADLAAGAELRVELAYEAYDSWGHAPRWRAWAPTLLREMGYAMLSAPPQSRRLAFAYLAVAPQAFTDHFVVPPARTRRRPIIALGEENLCKAFRAFDLAYRYFGSMAASRERDAFLVGYVAAVASDDRPCAGEPLADRERRWFAGPSQSLHDQREAAQPREVRAGPSAGDIESDPDGDRAVNAPKNGCAG